MFLNEPTFNPRNINIIVGREGHIICLLLRTPHENVLRTDDALLLLYIQTGVSWDRLLRRPPIAKGNYAKGKVMKSAS